MKVSLQWLGEHVDFSEYSVESLDDLLTFAGIEVEGIRHLPEHVVVAQVLSSDPHPDAEKLSVCQVDDGSGTPRQIVCGAKNYRVGDKVPLALPGCVLVGGDGKSFTIKEGKLRGVDSLGMMCSASEIGLSDGVDGLLILSPELPAGTPLKDLYPAVFELEITPNRPDCLSHLGVARELAALAAKPLRGRADYRESAIAIEPAQPSLIELRSEACPYYTGRIIRGVKVGSSPLWLREKLESIGLRPVNNVVDVTNYVLFEMGQPLHAFDLAKLQGGIVVREAEPAESFLALDGKRYSLERENLVIADGQGPVAVAGVMGGELSGVTEETTDILLEAAYFDPQVVRRSGRRLGLFSDSSYRFERGVDASQVLGASELAVKLIVELAGGEAEAAVQVAGAKPAEPQPVTLDNDKVRSLIGAEISDGTIDSILTSLGLSRDGATWTIPSYRKDLARPVDLMEEVARVYGLEQVPSLQKAWFSAASKADAYYDLTRKLQNRLAGLGFYETRNLKLISESQLTDDVATPHRGMGPVRLKNPLNDEQNYLRTGILPGLLATVARNQRFAQSDLRLYEMGRVFTSSPKGDQIEHEHFGLVMTGARAPKGWCGSDGALDIHDLRAVLEQVTPDGLNFVPVEKEGLLAAVSVELGSGKKAVKLGFAGILVPARARELDVKGAVLVAELNLKKLASAFDSEVRYQELPKFPGSSRDAALLAPVELRHAQVEEVLAAHQEPLLQSFHLFDVYADPSGQKLPADKKSLAYTFLYRAADRTMEGGEVDAAHAKVLQVLQTKLPVEFR